METILLVEDEPDIRTSLKVLLEEKYHVLEASTCSEALRQIKNQISLALIDYRLPDRDGFELLAEIKKIKPLLPVIIMTGYGTESVAVRAFKTGATDYVKKPIRYAYLIQKISELLGGNNKSIGVSEQTGNKEEIIMENIAMYIEDNYMKDMTLDKLADIACMDRFRLCRLFKEKFGKGFIACLTDIRLKNAIELLGNPDIKITEIAYLVGYDSYTHFERVFKKKYGATPKEYRTSLILRKI